MLLQVVYKKNVPKNSAIFTRMYRYRSLSLSGCRPSTCNFVKSEGPVQVFCSELCEILRGATLNGCSWTLRGVAGNKYSRN